MKNSNLHIPELQLKFKGDNIISFDGIKQFYRNISPEIKDTTLKTRINRLIKHGIVSRVGRGRYILGQEKNFVPYIDETIKKIAKKIDAEFPELKFCIGHTSWLSSFMIHQPARHYIIVEPESDSDQRTLFSETIFRFLQNSYKHVFHKPDSKIVQNYVSEYNDSIIVLPLVSEAPVQKHDNIIIPTIEKILVDIFCDENIFAAQQGNEKAVIFNEAFKQYTINTSKLLRYAARRTKRAEMEDYLKLLRISF